MDKNPNYTTDADIPLVLDVDGTLLRTDLLYETFWAALGHSFQETLLVVATKWRCPEQLKRNLAGIARPRIDLLPVRDTVLEMARTAQAVGRRIHLVSGSDQELINDLATQLDLPGPHFGSNSECNLTGVNKAAFLKNHFGTDGYDYAGNAHADLKSWAGARKIIAVQPGAMLATKIEALGKPVEIIAESWGMTDILREIRPRQWVKNLLLFLPLLASHTFSLVSFLSVCLAAVALSFGASALYILNDLLDLEADRSHPEKRYRPIAAGNLPISAAMQVSMLLAFLAVFLAFLVNPIVALLTVAYMVGSLSYSLWLKKIRWLDLIALTSLFLLRIVTGAAAAGVSVTPQLFALVFTVFFTLACVKRLTALSRMRGRDHLPGRGYSFKDLIPLERVGYFSAALSGATFLIFIRYENSAGLYSAPVVAALAVVPLLVWLFRMVHLGVAGREDYDPVRFAMHDRVGLALAGLGAILLFLAI